MSSPAAAVVDELLLFRTAERDRFEEECYRLRRERDDARERLQWFIAAMTYYGYGFIDGWAHRAVEVLGSLWPNGPKDPIAFLGAVRAKIKQAHCDHPDEALDCVSRPVAMLICNACEVRMPASGLMTRLLEERERHESPMRIPPSTFIAFVAPPARINVGPEENRHFPRTAAAVQDTCHSCDGLGGTACPHRCECICHRENDHADNCHCSTCMPF